MGRLEGKAALVTGAGSGIGRAVCELFADEGALIAASDIDAAAADAVALAIAERGGTAFSVRGDVANPTGARRMVSETVAEFGRLDLLVNSAGVTSRSALPESASAESVWDRVIEVNLKGVYLACANAVPEMEKAGGGAIVNLASIMGLVGYPPGIGGGFNPYPPSKGGVVQFTKTLAVDAARKNIRVNCLCPGFIETNMTAGLTSDPAARARIESLHPMGRMGRPEEVARAALYLASDDAKYVTGAALAVDGGYTAV